MDNEMNNDDSMDQGEVVERHNVAIDIAGRLHNRGVEVSDRENPSDLVDLLTAVERFEAAVEACGGDLMLDDIGTSRPDDPRFVLPRRKVAESIREYAARVGDAAGRLRSGVARAD